jgi:homoserine O-succinyltransferase
MTHHSFFRDFSDIQARADKAPLNIAVLNLMPDKTATEDRFRTLLPDAKLHFVKTLSYQSKHTDVSGRYHAWLDIAPEIDALIITGAPLGQKDYAEVTYWLELASIIKDATARRIPILALCWGALAVGKILYGLDKVVLDEKISGNYAHTVTQIQDAPVLATNQLVLPVSRYGAFNGAQLAASELQVLAGNDAQGAQVLWDARRHVLLCTAHPEYAPDRLQFEYERDLSQGLNPQKPVNGHYPDSFLAWHGQRFFSGWQTYLEGLQAKAALAPHLPQVVLATPKRSA